MQRIHIVGTVAASLALAACSDLLTEKPGSFLTTGTFYSTVADARAAVIAAYQPSQDVIVSGWSNALGYEGASDDANAHPLDQNPPAQAPGTLAWDATTNYQIGEWAIIYRSIYRANLALEKLPDSPLTDAEKAASIAEMKFIRGWDYLYLAKIYGGDALSSPGVPIAITTTDQLNVSPTRQPVDAVLTQALKDLTEAEAGLVATRPAAEWGRATKTAAWAALADLYLWRSSRYNTAQWQAASDWSKKIIDGGICGTGVKCRLLDDYISQFLPTNKGNAEMIWVRTSSGIDTRSSTDSQDGWFPRELSPGGGFGVVTPTKWVYESLYENGDYRKEQNFRVGGCNTTGTQCFTVFPMGPHPFKYRPTNLGTPGLSNTDFPWYHFDETLAVYAEAQNELGNTATAIQTLNLLRARARKGAGTETRTVPADLAATVSKQQAREIIYTERHRELLWEGERWYDLVRADNQIPGFFVRELTAHDPDATRRGPVTTNKKTWPVPQVEVDNSAGSITQNPGY
jgi:hypothetical protein